MRKEILLALIAGVMFGLVIAFGVWRANKALVTNKETPTTAKESEEKPTPTQGLDLAIANPKDQTVITQNPIAISGLTSPESWLVISSEDTDHLLKSEEDGSFEKEIKIEGGLNQILLTVFDRSGKSSKHLSLIFSTEFEKSYQKFMATKNENGKEETTATNEADLIEKRVEEKIEIKKRSPLAYLGTITDLTDSTIQIESLAGEVEQISIIKETDYVSFGKINKNVEFDDVALGDFIIAMGFVNEKKVLEAVRILITSAPEKPNRTAYLGKVVETAPSEITILTNESSEQIVVTPIKTTKVTSIGKDGNSVKFRFSEIEEGDQLIVVGQKEKEDFIVRSIQIIPQ